MPAHKHAALMAEYAEVAKTSETPWTEFEFMSFGSGEWRELQDSPSWDSHCEYRRKQWRNPHKDLILQYAQDCISHKEPWKLWETNGGVGWNPCTLQPVWFETVQYRRKDQS